MKKQKNLDQGPVWPQWIPFLLLLLFFLVHFMHFNTPQRFLIDYDDKTFVAPLIDMSWRQYWDEWFPNRNNYAFPFRDLSFWMDFRLSEALGSPVYWFTNWLLVLVIAIAIYRIIALYVRRNSPAHILPLGLIFFHPSLVEVIQWASIRKHILVGALLSFPTYWALKKYKEKKCPGNKDWVLWLFFWTLSLATWPSGLLWMFWVIWLFRSDLSKNFSRARLLGGTTIFLAFVAVKIAGGGSDYSGGAANLFNASGVFRAFENAFYSLGRGMFNLLFPFWLQPYYELKHPLNYAGWIFIVLAAVWLIKKSSVVILPRLELWVLAGLYFIPQTMVFLTYHEFVWSDRYLFLSLPFFTTAIAAYFAAYLDKKPIQIILSLYIGVFAIVAYMQIPRWYDDMTLMSDCLEKENSYKCLILTMEKKYDRQGCMGAMPVVEKGYQRMKGPIHSSEVELQQQVLFYDGLCIADLTNYSAEQKANMIQEICDKYPEEDTMDFFRVISYLQRQQPERAYQVATQRYLDMSKKLKLGVKFINVLRGQAKALCEINPTDDCKMRQAQFFERTKHLAYNQSKVTWGYYRTMKSVNK